ncbi:MAG: hypothetical protein JNK05_35835 [Myxococcales bacterium]|nr:hypothetical protein [Myxococcales bacterium]
MKDATKPRAHWALRALSAIVTGGLKLLWVALVVVAPLFAAWLASSLAAHSGGSTRVAIASALLVFPVVPVLWELVARWRHARAPKAKPRVLTTVDRLVLRTLFASLVFVGVLLARSPQRVFLSLNSRGDWMLDGRAEPWVPAARRALLRAAARSQWLYTLTDNNPLHRPGTTPPPRPIETRRTIAPTSPPPSQQPAPPQANSPSTATPVDPPRPQEPPRDPRAWPVAAELHVAVRELPASEERSPRSVARYLASRITDPFELAKAVHDYVADRVAYDVPSYRAGRYPPQDANTVFRTRLSVCAGYAALFEVIARAAGLEVVTIVGRARGSTRDGMGEGHAWNAVRLENQWRLIDTTWDAGGVDATGFHKRFSTMYFLTPPEVFLARHWPDHARWQLVSPARTAGEYLRMPLLRPEFFAHGLTLLEPTRPELDVRGSFEVRVENPRGRSLIAALDRDGGGESRRCTADDPTANSVRFLCVPPEQGTFRLELYASEQRYGEHENVGSIDVHYR